MKNYPASTSSAEQRPPSNSVFFAEQVDCRSLRLTPDRRLEQSCLHNIRMSVSEHSPRHLMHRSWTTDDCSLLPIVLQSVTLIVSIGLPSALSLTVGQKVIIG